jgi:hypothetical protein
MKVPELRYPIEVIKKATSVERFGGTCYFSICGAGETLIPDYTLDIVRALLDNGHFVGSVGNVGVMALPVWHEEAVLDPELLPLSYAVSILFAYSSYISEERMSQ